MTEQELKKLSRLELLELMVEQSKEIDQLRAVVADQEARLADRIIRTEKCGNIAEAAINVNGVFEAAQAAAQQYLDNIKGISDAQQEKSNRMLEETERSCQEKTDNTIRRCQELLEETKKRCSAIEEQKAYMEANLQNVLNQEKAEAEKNIEQQKQEALSYIQQQRQEADAYHDSRIAEADAYYQDKISHADAEIEKRWENLSGRLESFYQAHAGLRELLSSVSNLNVTNPKQM